MASHDYGSLHDGLLTLHTTARAAQAAAREAVAISDGDRDCAIADMANGHRYIYRRVGRKVTRERGIGNIAK